MRGVSTQRPSGSTGLVLKPLRGLRYAPDRVSSLAAVTSPPYDVLDNDAVLALESADPHNVVRLILPREEESGPEGRYEHAARTLRAWAHDGTLVPDATPGLYVYEQAAGGVVTQRGLMGALGLRDPADRVVLPHEDVMPGPVADRLELMRAARANVEPILLMYEGADSTAAIVDRIATTDEPLLSATGSDAVTHRLWRVSEPDDLSVIERDLRDRQALIADGHHRYAAYRLLQEELRDRLGSGPWDEGLALLVDLRANPPKVGAIHRTVDGLTAEEALAGAAQLFDIEDVPVEDVRRRLAALAPGRLLVVDAQRAAVLTAKDPARVAALVTARHPAQWADLDTAVLHQVLVQDTWDAPESALRYHHDPEQALSYARKHTATAVMLAPVPVDEVLRIAGEGVRMPRKSTSFGPKPRTGLLLRSFDIS
jgi:uncharacterized protein (DUF1015 family)